MKLVHLPMPEIGETPKVPNLATNATNTGAIVANGMRLVPLAMPEIGEAPAVSTNVDDHALPTLPAGVANNAAPKQCQCQQRRESLRVNAESGLFIPPHPTGIVGRI